MIKSLKVVLVVILSILTSACGERVPIMVTLEYDTGSVIGAKVTLTSSGENKPRVYSKTANTIDVVFEKVVPGKYILAVEHEDYFPFPEVEIIAQDSASPFIVNLYKNGPAVFSITSNVGSVNGAIVTIMNDEGQTLQQTVQGWNIYFPRLIPGTLSVEVSHDDFFTYSKSGISAISLVCTTEIMLARRGQANCFVFFDKGYYSDGWRYFEAAPAHTEFELNWYFSQVSSMELGFNGFSDWYLPDRYELNLMFQYLKMNNIGGFRNIWYWSSTPLDDKISHAWLIAFDSGINYPGEKRIMYQARAIRKF